MKMKVRSVAFALLLAPAILFADSINVTFDAALTNTTEWTYVGNIKTSKNGDYYINGQDVRITSPCYDFAITSIVMRVSTSGSCTRNLIISSCDNETISQPQEFTNIPQGTSSDITATWNIADRVRTLAITSTSGAQNLYFHSAVISGVPIVEAPTNLQTDNITGTRCRLSWANDGSAVSNRIDVCEVVEKEIAGGSTLEYSFDEFTNSGGQARDITEEFTNAIPAFAGSSVVKLPASTAGIIQISDGNGKGFLVHSGFQDCSKLSLRISLKIPTDRQGKDFGIGYEDSAGHTNEFPLITMVTNNFVTHSISLATLPANTPLIFNTHGSGSKRVVYIDYLTFVNNSPSTTSSTNLVKTVFTTGNAATIKGLSPNSSYVVSVSAFDEDGNESKQSELISFMTGSEELPFIIRLQ